MHPEHRTIHSFSAALVHVPVGAETIALYAVPDLEALVDREALLRGEAEPPYWAYLWTGARVLARYLASFETLAGRRVLEIGCGLGLPGLVAARAGARVTFVDQAEPALAFVRASAALHGVPCTTVAADMRTFTAPARFDLVIAAEVVYDRDAIGLVADVLEAQLAPGGVGLVSDGYRTDTRGFYHALAERDFASWAIDCRPEEEGRRIPLRVTRVMRRSAATRQASAPKASASTCFS